MFSTYFNAFRFVLRYMKPFLSWFIAGWVLLFISSCCTVLFPFLLKNIIDKASASHIKGNANLMMLFGVLFLVVIVQLTASYFKSYFFSLVSEWTLVDMRCSFYEKMLQMQMAFYSGINVSELTNCISDDMGNVKQTVSVFMGDIVKNLIIIVLGVSLVIYISKQLAFVTLLVFVLVFFVSIFSERYVRDRAVNSRKQLNKMVGAAAEAFQLISVVKSFCKEHYEYGKFRNKAIAHAADSVVLNRIQEVFSSICVFCFFALQIFMIWYGLYLRDIGSISIGGLTAFIIYIIIIGENMASISDKLIKFQKTITSINKIRNLMAEKMEDTFIEENTGNVHYVLNGNIKMQNVCFSYPSRPGVKVLSNLNLEVSRGEHIGIVGLSGSGKTTIASLLLRFYDLQSGEIYFDEKQISSIAVNDIRRQIAIVSQDIQLFSGSIRDNISYGSRDVSDDEIVAAAKKAFAHDFISDLPEAYETIVGERGVKISGGQRQRIAIARAILKNPAILILDEATSSLDPFSEIVVVKALENLMIGRTTFVIAHHLNVIRNLDKIIVMEHGAIVENGRHQELVQKTGGVYATLFTQAFNPLALNT